MRDARDLLTLAELAARVGGEVDRATGPPAIDGVAPLEDAGASHALVLLEQEVPQGLRGLAARRRWWSSRTADVPPGRTVLRVQNAYLAFAKISTLFHPPREPLPEVAPEAVIHPTARVHPSAQVMPLACVGPGAEIGARTIALPRACTSADGARVGDDCVLYPNVVVRERCVARQTA